MSRIASSTVAAPSTFSALPMCLSHMARYRDEADSPTLWPPHLLPEAAPKVEDKDLALTSVEGERRKGLGAFYTPPELVDALTAWAIRAKTDRVLEPAAGEAIFLLSALRRLRELGAERPAELVTGVEIDPEALSIARGVLAEAGEEAELVERDFFQFSPSEAQPFTAVVGNPPYVRYHRFRGEARRRGAHAAAAAGVELTGLASSWAPFVLHASQFLVPEGRLAFVLPGELLRVDYASSVREFLVRRFGSVTVVTFEKAVFPGAMIDTVLLMAEGGGPPGIRVLRLRDASDLGSLTGTEPFRAASPDRWSSLLTPSFGAEALQRLRASGLLRPLGDVASVDIGFVSGANDFFVLTSDEAKRRALPRRTFQPAIARPGQLRGAILGAADAKELLASEPCLVLGISGPGADQRDTALGRYLRSGKRLGVHRGYKCRGRSPWYSVPGIRVPDAFMSYMSNVTPRVALNQAGFSSSNLVHQIQFHITEKANARAFIAALHSSVSRLSFEVEGRSYGGGVLKHETREAERVEFPWLDALASPLANVLHKVDVAMRVGGPDAAADVVDSLLLKEGVMTSDEVDALRRARSELYLRRSARGKAVS